MFSAYENTKACHFLYKILEESAGEEIEGGIGFVFEEYILFAVGNTVSGKKASVSLGINTRKERVSFILDPKIRSLLPIKEILEKLQLQSSQNKLTIEWFRKRACAELLTFFAVNYQNFG